MALPATGYLSVAVAVEQGVPARLKAAVEAEEHRRTVASAAPQWRSRGLPRDQAAARRAAWRAHVQHLRSGGQLLDTREALAACGLRAELAARGWDHPWDGLPDEAVEPGRWPGVRELGLPERVSLRLPQPEATWAQAGCWFTSEPAIRHLRAWRDAHPGLVPPRRPPAPGHNLPPGPLRDYERLAAAVTSTGVIWRAALARGIAAAHHLTATTPPPAGT